MLTHTWPGQKVIVLNPLAECCLRQCGKFADRRLDRPLLPVCALCYRSEPSRPFKIAVTGSKADIKVKGSKTTAQLSAKAPAMMAEAARRLQQQQSLRVSRTRDNHMQAIASGSRSAYDSAAAAAAAAGTASTGSLAVHDPEAPCAVPVQRQYEFAAEVWAAPADGPFRATKVVSIKSKYILFNDTGMVLEYKQRGTPDATHPGYSSYGEGRRFAGLLQPQER